MKLCECVPNFSEGRRPEVLDAICREIEGVPGIDARAWLEQRRRSPEPLASLLTQHWPKRFAQQWCEVHGLVLPPAQMSDKAIDDALRHLRDWTVQPSGTLGYNKAEVTLGGIDTRGLSSRTMEASSVRGLFFIGEAVDVTGHLGGFNFQWAWASARAAGSAV